MSWMHRLRRGLWVLLHRETLERDMDAEMRFHVEMETEELLRERGIAPGEARRQALIAFAGVERYKDLARDVRISMRFEELARDLRYGARALVRRPGFTAVAVITLALAIGATTAIFTIVNAVLLRPLPYTDSDRIVTVRHHAPGLDLPQLETSAGLIAHYRESARSLTRMAAIVTRDRNLGGGERPERVRVAEVTPEFFDVLATRPNRGRQFLEPDAQESAPPVAILTHATWRSRFGADPDIVGRHITLDGTTAEVVGVMPEGFTYRDRHGGFPALLVPLWIDPADALDSFGIHGIARLVGGADLEAARRELEALQHRIPERFPDDVTADFLERAGWSVSLETLKDRTVGDVATTLWVLLATAGLVLLIAAANVANLFLVRTESRRRETAVRAALGASRGRLARTFLTESLLLGLLAGGVGVIVAIGGVQLLVAFGPTELPRLHEVNVDATVFAFAVGLSVLSGLALGALPLPRHARASVGELLRGGRGSTAGRDRHRVRRLLIVGQMALALVLLVSAGLMLRSVVRLHAVDPGLRPDGVLAVGVSLGDLRDRERTIVFYHRVLDEVAALPGAVSVGATNNLPIELSATNGGSFAIESRPRDDDELPPVSMWAAVTEGYFETLEVPTIDGRAPVRADAEGGRPVAWVNETFARRFLDGRAVGERVRFGEDTVWAEIVGVVGDVREFGLNEEIRPTAYLPLSTARPVQLDLMQLVVRTDESPAALLRAIRAAVTRVDPSVPLTTVRTMDEVVASSLARVSFTVLLLGIAAAVALVLGVVGLYGVISYIVSQRTAEIGIRIALGAHPGAVRALVIRQGLGVAIAGLLIGLAAATAVTRVLDSLLFDVSARDPLTFATVVVVLAAVSLVATYLPARRATRVDPIVALRAE